MKTTPDEILIENPIFCEHVNVPFIFVHVQIHTFYDG